MLNFSSVIKLISFLLWFSRYSGFNMSHFPENCYFLPKCHFHDEFKVTLYPELSFPLRSTYMLSQSVRSVKRPLVRD
jgi:hypothetical protein